MNNQKPTQIWRITEEPTGETYRKLLTFSLERCTTFVLVRRYGRNLGQSAKLLATSLAPFLMQEKEGNEWPGTITGGGVLIRTYQLTPNSVQILVEASGLYSWTHAKRLEDLSLNFEDGTVWLWSTAHEHEAYIRDTDARIEKLRQRVPGLQIAPATHHTFVS